MNIYLQEVTVKGKSWTVVSLDPSSAGIVQRQTVFVAHLQVDDQKVVKIITASRGSETLD